MTYQHLIDVNDTDILQLCRVMDLANVSRFISYDKERYWQYVTSTNSVFYYKVYKRNSLLGAIHLEISGKVLYMSILVFPEYQNQKIGSSIIKDIQDRKLPIDFERIEVSIDETNVASIRLFEKMNFKLFSKEKELLIYVYQMPS